ncbi:MAG: ribosome recycling factor [Planctomycetes bacterium]|nr:ribosome recycling factor [Planctomycetota bacterium]HNZ66687.1 ribosome recycling factor [Planctomycetota bacterium]HON44996.1 ribosome recycling factor [Planctomycetota bacterium]HPY75642.1 ribosome recycling factor [Planctomycetota bacterium]HQB00575.1 ribosome recycling factor [Planctomycetota bacterium]
MSAEVLKEVEEKMDKACEVLVNDMKGLRTDRATPALVDNIRVEYYGSPTPLKQIANVSIPEPRILIIKPFDASSLKNIEKAILKSDLGITPANDGKMLRLTVPVLSEERRLQLINQVKDLTEKAKVAIRNIRRDANKKADQLEKDKLLSEDENKKLQESIQKTTKSHEDEVDKLAEEKKKEILK